MAFTDTLLIRHLPTTLTKLEVEGMLKHIGAIEVTVVGSDTRKRIAFARFKSKEVAKEALFRLHQQELFGCRLVVEFSNSTPCRNEKNAENAEKKQSDKKAKLHEAFLHNLNNWTVGLNFSLPPPSHLYYQYPAPTAEVLLNIVNLLSFNTMLYTQVLHLMNKMNLPSPFESSFPLTFNDTFNSFIIYILENSVYEEDQSKTSQSSDEGSELESETEETKLPTKLLKKRAPTEQKTPVRRKIFKSHILSKSRKNTSTKSKAQVSDVFDKVEREPVKKIEVRIPTEIPITVHNTTVINEHALGFGVINPPEKVDEPVKKLSENDNNEKCISCEELRVNRLAERDRKASPFFKNYNPGVPSCRLYVKNLAKKVTVPDLEYIFKRYFVKGVDEQGTMFDIRLMQEGRMKGQAFITLQTVKQAELALKETNGFILKNKPMVVQFARSAVSK